MFPPPGQSPAAPRESEAQVPEGELNTAPCSLRSPVCEEGAQEPLLGRCTGLPLNPASSHLTGCPGPTWRALPRGNVGVWRAFRSCPPGPAEVGLPHILAATPLPLGRREGLPGGQAQGREEFMRGFSLPWAAWLEYSLFAGAVFVLQLRDFHSVLQMVLEGVPEPVR